MAASFAAGMILTDTGDSRIVAALLQRDRRTSDVQRYRRGVGWVIVGLSFGMAAYTLVTKLGVLRELTGEAFTLLGVGAMGAVFAVLVVGRARPRPS